MKTNTNSLTAKWMKVAFLGAALALFGSGIANAQMYDTGFPGGTTYWNWSGPGSHTYSRGLHWFPVPTLYPVTPDDGVALENTAGFSAGGGPLSVNFNGDTAVVGSQNFFSSGSGILLLNAPGTTNSLTTTFNLDLAGHNLQLQANSAAAGGTVYFNGQIQDSIGGGVLTQNGVGTIVYNAYDSMNQFVVQTGTAVLNSNNNIYNATIIQSGGTLDVGAANALGNSSLYMEGGVLGVANGAQTVNNNIYMFSNGTFDTSGGNLTLNGFISGVGALVKQGGGTLTVTGNALQPNTYSGGTWDNAGWLAVGNNGALGNGQINMNGGTLSTCGTPITLANFLALLTAAPVDTTGGNLTLNGVISGVGNLVKDGANSLIVSNVNNSYSGGTTINAGYVVLGGNNVLGSGTVTMNGGTLTSDTGAGTTTILTNAITLASSGYFDNSGSSNLFLSGNINGGGAFVQSGPNSITLTGNNSYTGGTTNSSGVLYVGNGGTSGNLGTGGVLNNSSIVFNRTDTLTDGNVISGTGSLTQNGTGTLILTGNSTYTGGTTISHGVLQLGNGGASGSVLGSILDNSSLVFNRSDIVTNVNFISGTGSLTQTGAGTVILTSNQTYTGGTTISHGTLQLGNGGTSGSVLGAILDNSSLVFNRSDIVTNGNVISGSGSLTQAGSGTIIISATNNTYTGGTTISHGWLQLGSNNVLSTGTLNMNGGTLESGTGAGTTTVLTNAIILATGVNAYFDSTGSSNLLLSGAITGAGTNVLRGVNTVTLASSNSYSGGTIVNTGTLSLENRYGLGSGDMRVLGGTLDTTDPLFGPIYVGGNYTQAAAGTLELAIASTAQTNYLATPASNVYGTLTVTNPVTGKAGTASLGGTLRVMQGGTYIPYFIDHETMLVASNVTGTFSTLDVSPLAPSALLTPNLTYTSNSVTLNWAQNSFVVTNWYALTPNQLAVAHAMDSTTNALSNWTAVRLINYLDYSGLYSNGLPYAYDLIAPEEFSAMAQSAFAGMDARGYSLLSRVNELRSGSHGFSANRLTMYDSGPGQSIQPVAQTAAAAQIYALSADGAFSAAKDNPWGVYLEGNGAVIHDGGDGNASGYNLNTYGVTVGLDRRLGENFAIGLTLGYNNNSISLNNGGHIDVDNEEASLYATWFNQGFHLEGMVGAGLNSYTTSRSAINGMANSSNDGTEFTGLIGGGYDWQKGIWRFGPQLTLQYEHVAIDGFTETGSYSPLTVNSQNDDSLQTSLGAHVDCRVKVGSVFVSPSLSLAWKHEYDNNNIAITSQFANGAGNAFTVTGPVMGGDSAVGSVGINVEWSPTVGTYLNFTTELGRTGYTANSINGGLNFRF